LEAGVKDTLARIGARLAGAERILFVTGAGMSADSGVPTYRGVGGLYDSVATSEGIAIEEVLSGRTMDRDPSLCWKYIMQIEAACRGARPNAGHRAIFAFEQRFGEIWVLTQNVDGLHRVAGSRRVIDIHGDVRKLLCGGCGWRAEVDDYSELSRPPRCPRCGAVVRPEVVLFGEMLPLDKLARLRSELERGFDAVFSVGTSSLFPYIAEPVLLARMAGALTVEINPSDTLVSDAVEERLRVGASEALDALRVAMGVEEPG
jgi:NAD-dependent deacetylase